MQINDNTYTVYPDLRSIIYTAETIKNTAEVNQLNESNTSLSIARQKVLTNFFDHFLTISKQ